MSSKVGRIYDRREWRRVRQVVLQRDHWTCQRCGKTAGAMEVHHTVRGGGSDPFDPDACVTICRTCHFVLTAAERTSASRRSWDALVDDAGGCQGSSDGTKGPEVLLVVH